MIALRVLSPTMIFQPFSLTLYGIGAGLWSWAASPST